MCQTKSKCFQVSVSCLLNALLDTMWVSPEAEELKMTGRRSVLFTTLRLGPEVSVFRGGRWTEWAQLDLKTWGVA